MLSQKNQALDTWALLQVSQPVKIKRRSLFWPCLRCLFI